MAGKEIKQTIRLDGEREYSAAIKEAQRNLRTLRGELKAETAELGSNATAQQKNELRVESLKKQIAEQEKVVETLKKALNEAKSSYGDNQDVVQKWEQKLSAARTTLANMQNGLSDAEEAMRGTSDATAEGTVATKAFADALESIASVGESVSGAIEDIFTGLVTTVRDTVVELWEMIGETASKANNWTDIAGYWDTDPANVEKWARAVEASGNAFGDFEAIVTRLNLGGKGEDISQMLGINEADFEDQWAYAVAVMDRISELQQSGDMPENLWETLFGERRGTKAMDIINDWDTIKEGLTTFDADAGGFGMGEDALAAMNDVWVQMSEIEQKWIALKDQFAAGLGTITADLLVNVSGSLDALNEFMNADSEEEREAALEKLRTNVEEFFRKLAEAIEAGLKTLNDVGKELSESDDPIVSAIGNLMVQLTDALQWIVNNQDKVKLAFEALFGVWLMGKLAKVAGSLASIITQIELIKNFKAPSVLAGAAEGAAGAGAGGAAGSGGILAGLKSMSASMGMAGGAATALPIAAMAGAGIAGAKMIEANLDDERLNAVYGDRQGEGGMLDTMSEETWRRAFEYYRVYSDAEKTGTDEAFDARDALAASLEADGVDLSEQAVSLLENTFENLLNETDPDGMIEAIEGRYPGFFDQDASWQDAVNAVDDHIDQVMLGTSQGGLQEGLTREDVGAFRGLPAMMRQALMSRISDLTVTMDGEKVGRILTPYVSTNIARDAQ